MELLTSLFLALTTIVCSILYVLHRLLEPEIPTKGTTNIPGPVKARWWPILGHALWFWGVKNMKDFYSAMWQISEKRDKLVSFYMGSKLWIFVVDAKILEAIISNANKCQNKDPSIYGSFNKYSNGVFSKNGKGWSIMRRPLDRFLHPKNMENFHRITVNKAEVLCKKMEDQCGQGVTTVVDAKHLIELCTVDITLESFLDVPGTQQIENTMHVPEIYSKALENMFSRIIKLQYSNDWIYSLAAGGRAMRKTKDETRPSCKMMVTNCYKQMKIEGRDPSDPNFTPKNFIEVAIQTSIYENTNEENLLFSFCDLIEAGYDTTSVTISTALLYLAMHPEYQERAYHEQIEVMKDSLEAPTREDLSAMSFLERVVNETLRHVSVPAVGRTVSSQFTIDDYIFPEGAVIMVFNNALFNDPRYWERPKDFYPDHFLPEKVAARPKGAFLPFAFGGRSCPGKMFGIQSSKLILAMLLRRFKFTTTLKYEELDYKYMIMLESNKGYPFEVTPRLHHSNEYLPQR